jgi:F-type H+-transporting ATPase subunit epsilon
MTELRAEKLRFDLVTPHRALLSVEADEVVAPGVAGSFGIRPGHTAFLSELGGGVLSYTLGGKADYFAVAGGFCEVAENRVTVLADFAEHTSSIDPVQAQRDLEAAQARASEALHKDEVTYRLEEAAVRNAAARVAASRHR